MANWNQSDTQCQSEIGFQNFSLIGKRGKNLHVWQQVTLRLEYVASLQFSSGLDHLPIIGLHPIFYNSNITEPVFLYFHFEQNTYGHFAESSQCQFFVWFHCNWLNFTSIFQKKDKPQNISAFICKFDKIDRKITFVN